MEIKLHPSDVKPDFRDYSAHRIKFRHLVLKAKIAAMVAGRAVYYAHGNYSAILTPAKWFRLSTYTAWVKRSFSRLFTNNETWVKFERSPRKWFD